MWFRESEQNMFSLKWLKVLKRASITMKVVWKPWKGWIHILDGTMSNSQVEGRGLYYKTLWIHPFIHFHTLVRCRVAGATVQAPWMSVHQSLMGAPAGGGSKGEWPHDAPLGDSTGLEGLLNSMNETLLKRVKKSYKCVFLLTEDKLNCW